MKIKNIVTSFAVAAVATVSSMTAQADDSFFSGPYVGAEVGFTDLGFADDAFDFDSSVDTGANGLFYSAIVGYRMQLDNGLVVGLEGSVGGSSSDITDGDDKYSTGRQLGIDATIGTTLGNADNILLFAAVGYRNARATITDGTDSYSANGDGVKFGVGVEYAFSETISLRTTANYINYEADVREIQVLVGVLFNF